jgi:hypothetical protein
MSQALAGRRSVLRYTVVLLLLSACASEPEYPSPYAGPGYTYVDMYGDATYVPGAPVMGGGPCASYDLSATPPPVAMYPCPMSLTSPYPGYGYAFYPAFGYSFFGARSIRPFHAGAHIGHSFSHAGGRAHAGGRGGRR